MLSSEELEEYINDPQQVKLCIMSVYNDVKPTVQHFNNVAWYNCGVCGAMIASVTYNNCSNCGQLIDWTGIKK